VSSIVMGRRSLNPPHTDGLQLAHSSDFARNRWNFFDSKFSMSCVRFEVLAALSVALSTDAVPSFDENPLSLVLLEDTRF
jgi:hypothetical protein